MTRTAPRSLLLASLTLLTCTTGCVGLRTERVELVGTIHEIADTTERPLTFTFHGRPLIHGQGVELPRAQEDRHYGLVVVDTTSLPLEWRLPSAPEGGIVVSAVDRASPLAIAGLRCGDQILELVGSKPPLNVHGLATHLEAAKRVKLRVRSYADGAERTIEAEAVDALRDVSHWGLPIVMSYTSSNTASGVRLGPYGALFNRRGALVTDDRRYLERNEWGFLFDLIVWEAETDPLTGESQGRLRLFWFLSIGSDLIP